MWKSALAVFLLFAMAVAFFWKILVLGQVFFPADILYAHYAGPWATETPWGQDVRAHVHNDYHADAVHQYYPFHYRVREMLQQGVLPLWNPYAFCGSPLMANAQSAVWYPLTLLFSFTPLSVASALGYIALIQLFLSGLAMYFFLREIRVGRFGALVGGTVFMFNGFFMAWLHHPTFHGAGLWLPLILCCMERALTRNSVAWALVGGIPVGMSVLAGHPQVSLYVFFGAAIYALFRLCLRLREGVKTIAFSLVFLCLPFVVGFSLAAIQIIPTLELAQHFPRSPYPFAWYLREHFPYKNLVTFLIPDVFGNHVDKNYFGPVNYVELNGYSGILPLLLAGVACLFRRDRTTLFFVGFLFLALSFLLGTPTFALLYYALPGLDKVNNYRVMYLVTFALSVLAGLGADFVNSSEAKKQQRHPRLFMFGALLIGGLVTLAVMVWAGLYFGIAEPKFAYETHNLTCFFVLLLASLLLLSWWQTAMVPPSLARGAAIAVIFLDMFFFGQKWLTFTDPHLVFPETAMIQFLKKDTDIYRITGTDNILFGASPMIFGISDMRGYDVLFPKRYDEFVANIVGANPLGATMVRIDDPRYFPNRESFAPFFSSRLLDFLNVKYVLVTPEWESVLRPIQGTDGQPKFTLVYANNGLHIYQNRDVLPRAFVVHKAQVIRDKGDLLAELKKIDPGQTVLLEEGSGLTPMATTDREATTSSAHIIENLPSHVVVDVSMGTPGFLVLSDNFYPGWKAFVNGEETKIFRANYTFRAIRLNSGRHRVEFVYDPMTFKVGLGLTLVALGVISGSLVHLLCVYLRPTPTSKAKEGNP